MSTSVERLAALQLAINHIGQVSFSGGQQEIEHFVDKLTLAVAKKFEAYIEGDPHRPVETTDASSRIETRDALDAETLCSRCGCEEHHITHVDNNPSFKHSFETQSKLEDQECGRCGVKLKDHVDIKNRNHVFEARKS